MMTGGGFKMLGEVESFSTGFICWNVINFDYGGLQQDLFHSQ